MGLFDIIGKITDKIHDMGGAKTTRDTLTSADLPKVQKEVKDAYIRPTQNELREMNRDQRVQAAKEFTEHRPAEAAMRRGYHKMMDITGLRTALIEASKAKKAIGRVTGLTGAMNKVKSAFKGKGGGREL